MNARMMEEFTTATMQESSMDLVCFNLQPDIAPLPTKTTTPATLSGKLNVW